MLHSRMQMVDSGHESFHTTAIVSVSGDTAECESSLIVMNIPWTLPVFEQKEVCQPSPANGRFTLLFRMWVEFSDDECANGLILYGGRLTTFSSVRVCAEENELRVPNALHEFATGTRRSGEEQVHEQVIRLIYCFLWVDRTLVALVAP